MYVPTPLPLPWKWRWRLRSHRTWVNGVPMMSSSRHIYLELVIYISELWEVDVTFCTSFEFTAWFLVEPVLGCNENTFTRFCIYIYCNFNVNINAFFGIWALRYLLYILQCLSKYNNDHMSFAEVFITYEISYYILIAETCGNQLLSHARRRNYL